MTGALLHSINDTARLLGIGRSTLFSLIANSRIRTVKIGRRTLVSDCEVKRFLNELLSGDAENDTP